MADLPRIKFDQINEAAQARLEGLLMQWLPGGSVQGREYKALNPTRSDSKKGSFSININNCAWGDFATGDQGRDPVSLYQYIRGHANVVDAARDLAEDMGLDLIAMGFRITSKEDAPQRERLELPPRDAKRKKPPEWEPFDLVPHDAPEPQFWHFKHGDASAHWRYLDATGKTIGYIVRFDLEDGKEILPLTYCRNESGKREWRWKSFGQPRPLYGADQLAMNPGAQVMVVEGEKCKDAALRLLPAGIVPVSWPGGSKAMHLADWSPLAGRKVIIWPDNDEAGEKCALGWIDNSEKQRPGLVQLISEAGALGVRIVRPPTDSPNKWDIADAEAEGWTGADVLAHIKGNLYDPASMQANDDAPPMPDEPHQHYDEYDPPPEVDTSPADETEIISDRGGLGTAPFTLLGYDCGLYFYLPNGSRQVTALKADQHCQSHLVTLASLSWWEMSFPGKQGANYAGAANAMIRKQESIGVYDSRKIRGRGAWEDAGRSVLHLGGHLVVDGKPKKLPEIETKFIYEAAAPMETDNDASPMQAKEAHKLVTLCDLLSWEKPISGKLLAGWCIVAPICGALTWRPHVWITGGAGTGKSWVVDNILRPAVGPAALLVQSNTTEAGLRQELKNDARPVIFDEAEGEDKSAQKRIQNVMELMRQASSETGASILKGTSSGRAMSFRIRSSFAFSSIGVNLHQQADATRVSVLSLIENRSTTKEEEFRHIKKTWAETMTPEFCQGLRARSVMLIPVIRKNAEMFGRAASEHLGSQRLGDQFGALLAGAYACHSSCEVSLEDARKWIKAQDWGEYSTMEESADEHRCLSAILETVVKAQGSRGFFDLSIGEMLEAALCYYDTVDGLKNHEADAALRRMGIRVDDDKETFSISNNHTALAKALVNTPWAKNWSRIIDRLDGAEKAGPMRFGAGSSSRATRLPVSYISGGEL